MFGNVGFSSGLISLPSPNLGLHSLNGGSVGRGVEYVWVGMYAGSKVLGIVPLSSCDAIKGMIEDYNLKYNNKRTYCIYEVTIKREREGD